MAITTNSNMFSRMFSFTYRKPEYLEHWYHWDKVSASALDNAAYHILVCGGEPKNWLLSAHEFAMQASEGDIKALRTLNIVALEAIHPDRVAMAALQRVAILSKGFEEIPLVNEVYDYVNEDSLE